MLFMVIETFRNGDALSAYRRFRDEGRGAPDGVEYVGSWIEASLNRCFQLMETDDIGLRHDLELHEVGPKRDPLLQEPDVVGLHQLEAAVEARLDPRSDVLDAVRCASALVAEPPVRRQRVPVAEGLDHHEQHAGS